ncbi:MarR family winged helix-turn-helix transcriptional regulator [Nonomuraea indica]|uniref:MarR family winged helix-turn-helix transcriptional regulator n=1 Tax=Nonomuraea indica TaxID=1581193 RepID=A0ABW8AEQ9_9ACTN|nr:MarR family transcriptional regulator [Nonomuraea indica]
MNALHLDNQLCFAVHAASRAFDALYRRQLTELGLTYPQYLVMLVLWEREPLSVKELGTALRLDSGTLSPLLKRLEAAGLVDRERDPADERSVLVRLTPEGARLRERAEPLPGRMLESTGMSPGELADLHAALGRLTRSLTEAAR